MLDDAGLNGRLPFVYGGRAKDKDRSASSRKSVFFECYYDDSFRFVILIYAATAEVYLRDTAKGYDSECHKVASYTDAVRLATFIFIHGEGVP